MKNTLKRIKEYFLDKNPVFVSLVSICPVITATTSVNTAFYMSCCVFLTLTLSEVFISMFRKVIPKKVAVHFTVIVTATFVTIISLFTKAFYPMYYNVISIPIALLVVNCLVRSKVRTFALHEDIVRSFLDGLLNSFAMCFTLMSVAVFREFFSTGSLLIGNYYIGVVPRGIFPTFFAETPGAFLSIGIVSLLINMGRHNKIIKAEFIEEGGFLE